MRPALTPVGNRRGDAHYFPDDKEPEYVPGGAGRSKAGAEPRTNNRNDDEQRRARDESRVGGDTASDEIAGEQAREQRVSCEDKNNREQVAANDDADRFQHWSIPPFIGRNRSSSAARGQSPDAIRMVSTPTPTASAVRTTLRTTPGLQGYDSRIESIGLFAWISALGG